MKEELIEYIKKWLTKADHDLLNAQLVVEHNPIILDTACYHCQQAVEKFLKAFLIFNEVSVKPTHNLFFLLEESSRFETDFTNVEIKNLNDFGTKIRYPDDFLVPTIEETKEYLQIACQIKEIVNRKINKFLSQDIKFPKTMKALLFPGQGSQFPGMGKELYDSNPQAKNFFEKANEILGFRITDIMFSGTEEDLKQTRVTQPAIFLHSVILFLTRCSVQPDMTAGHSLGEFSALVANKALTFESALNLVTKRANAMQRACEINPSTMAAVMGLDDNKVEEICASSLEVVVAANYNYPGQLVISGTKPGVEKVCELMKSAGAKRAILLPVGGAFHSPLMEPAKKELEQAILNAEFANPICPVYQNATGLPEVSPEKIRENLILQLTSPVRWTQSVQNMVKDGATEFIECGPGKVLQGLVRKIHKEAVVGEVG